MMESRTQLGRSVVVVNVVVNVAVALAGVITVGNHLRGLRNGRPTPPVPARFARARCGHDHSHGHDHGYGLQRDCGVFA